MTPWLFSYDPVAFITAPAFMRLDLAQARSLNNARDPPL